MGAFRCVAGESKGPASERGMEARCWSQPRPPPRQGDLAAQQCDAMAHTRAARKQQAASLCQHLSRQQRRAWLHQAAQRSAEGEGMADKQGEPAWDPSLAWAECQHALPDVSSSLMDMLPDPDRLLPFLASEEGVDGARTYHHGEATTSAGPGQTPPAVGSKKSADVFDDTWDTDPANKAARLDMQAAKSKAHREKQRRAQLNCRSVCSVLQLYRPALVACADGLGACGTAPPCNVGLV
jgi:hypothetical protein